MTGRRVVVTGLGPITPIGEGVDELRAGLRRERSPVRTVERFDPSPFRTRIAAELDGFDPAGRLGAKRARRVDRFSAFSLAACSLALEDAGLDPSRPPPDRVAVQMGTALGGVSYAEQQHGQFMERGLRGINPLLALSVYGGAASCNIAIEHGFTGPNSTNAMSCASGAMAIGRAFQLVRGGEADVALCGGSEAPLAPLTFGAFAVIRAMSTRNDEPETACRPFDGGRDGFVMGEGACVLVLEELGAALRRDARIYGEVCGFGTTSDAYHMTAPRPGGPEAARAMRLALEDAGVSPAAVDYVNAHGSSTPRTDSTEAEAIRSVFGERADELRVSGTKAYYGHALGASGAIEAAITLLSMAEGWFPPSLNLREPDERCDLPFIAPGGERFDPEYVLSNSFGFGGINATLA
ncbi:MAG: beta-ketoacyl-[acyl-carrier-protein] synthase family protein, partial [Gemmatimonadota bacterium]|nr:beta-ketoacyl-[acyl-carrier-protein] synthase family protein [Gemmatimonadota bacterium]